MNVPSDALIGELAVAAELCGTTLSKPAAKAIADELAAYPEPQVIVALRRCRRELKGRLTLAEILSRLDDGRPGVEEAWAMLAWDEDETAVLTAEQQQAQGAAWAAYLNGDRVGARMAFKEAYTRLVTEAREKGNPVEWQVSLGWDKTRREGPIKEAVQKCRLLPEVARKYIPIESPGESPILLGGGARLPLKIKGMPGRKAIGR